MNLLKQIENEQMAKLSAGKEIPDFQPGDTLVVNVKIVEGERSRVQAYEGVCIGRAGAGLNENFPTVRKISYGEGVERVFPLYLADDRTRSRWCAGAKCAAPSSIICADAAASRHASSSGKITARRAEPQRPAKRRSNAPLHYSSSMVIRARRS